MAVVPVLCAVVFCVAAVKDSLADRTGQAQQHNTVVTDNILTSKSAQRRDEAGDFKALERNVAP